MHIQHYYRVTSMDHPTTKKNAFIVGLLMLLIISLSNCSVISLQNIQYFFKSTYDTDNNGKASLKQFVNFFQRMEPEANIVEEDVIQTFHLFDSNNDNSVTLQQLMSIAQIKVGLKSGHKQIHIGFTNNQDQMQIMWVSNPQKYRKPIVHYGHFPTQLNNTSYAIAKTYNVGHFGFHGQIYRAVLTGLAPNIRYYYRVGDEQSRTFSQIKYFKSKPPKNTKLNEINLAVFGDMGTFAPCGHLVIHQIARDNFAKPYDFVFLTGDIAYAGIGSEKSGEIEPIWDLYGQLTQSFAAYSPFMPGAGNHEKYYNFSAYLARYELPKQYPGQTNLWFSFDYGQIHIAYFSCEHPFGHGSEQYYFLQNDLKNARANPTTKWIIVGTHRPFYSSNKRQYSNQTSLVKDLEELLNKYQVDIIQTGHIHSYQRNWPMYKGKSEREGHNKTHYVNPKHPVYVVQASAGALMYERWIEPAPQYAIKRANKYGYGRITVKEDNLRYQYIHAMDGKVLDEWYIIKR